MAGEEKRVKKQRWTGGFTLIELLLVLAIMGALLAIILPRGVRVRQEARFSQVRQDASEIASFVVKWGQEQTEAQKQDSLYTIVDFFMKSVDPEVAGFSHPPLVNTYTGDPAFDGVEALVPAASRPPTNPFNEVSYFNPVNNDDKAPSKKPGLLYLASGVQVTLSQKQRVFYFIFTGMDGKWHGLMDPGTPDGLRRGIFVTRQPESAKEDVHAVGGQT